MNKFLQNRLLEIVRLIVGAYGQFSSKPVAGRQTIFFANHTSHADTLAVLAALPESVRATVRPVAARDYWDASALRRFIANEVLDVVFVDRNRESGGDPLDPIKAALSAGSSIIIFPEGKRNTEPEMAPFKSGIYWLLQAFPDVDVVPVHLSNLARAMPRGKLLPIPFMCQVHFGQPMPKVPGESKDAFIERARQSVLALKG